MKLIENFYCKTKDENYNICYVKSKLILNQIIFRVVRIFNIICSEIPKGETIKLSVIVPNLLMWFDNFLTFQIKIMKNKSEFKFKMVQVIIEIIYPVIVDLFLYISYMIENNGDSKMCVKELKAWRSQLNNLCIMIINSLELCKEKGEVINNKCITIVLDIVYKAVLLTTFTSNNFISENQNCLNFKEFIIQSYQTNVNNSGECDFEVRNLYNKIKIIVYESLKEKKFELTENTLIFLEDFSYHLFTLFEGILCHSSISYCQDLVVPASIQMILCMVYGDMDIQKDYNQRMINDVCSQIKESINSNEGKLCSLKYRKKLILSLNYLSIISFCKISVDSKFRISDTNTSELYNMDETIKSKINDCIIILTEPFENFGVSFEHSKFIDHLKIISAISNKVDQSFLCQLTDIEDSIHRSNFIFLSKFLIPQCEFYGLHVQMIKLLLLNFCYLILLYHKRRSDPYNLLIHICKVCQVYYKLSKSSLEMHGNYLMCIKYIEGHIIRHKIDIKSHSVVLDCLIRCRYEQALSEDTFSQLSNLNQGFKNKIDCNKMSTNDWIQIASIQELRSIFQCCLPSQKWINKLELSIDQHNTYNDASFQQERISEVVNYIIKSNTNTFNDAIKKNWNLELCDDKLQIRDNIIDKIYLNNSLSPYSAINQLKNIAFMLLEVADKRGLLNDCIFNSNSLMINMIWISVQFGNANLYSKCIYYLMRYYSSAQFNWYLKLQEETKSSMNSKESDAAISNCDFNFSFMIPKSYNNSTNMHSMTNCEEIFIVSENLLK